MSQSGTLTVPSGSTKGTITVQVVGLSTVHGTRRFGVRLANATHASISATQVKATGYIVYK